MPRISRVSGGELATAPEEEVIADVRALKQHLNQLHNVPPRCRQRLLLHGQPLEDTEALHSAMELELVVLAFVPNPSSAEVREFTAAAGAGQFHKARASNAIQFRTQHSEQITKH